MYNTQTTRRQIPGAESTPVIVYGTRWCAATQQVRRFLDRYGVPYQFKDMDYDPDAENRVRWWTGGYASHPTVQIGGDILVEPSMDELRSTLARNGLI
jgi:mycoredoxin